MRSLKDFVYKQVSISFYVTKFCISDKKKTRGKDTQGIFDLFVKPFYIFLDPTPSSVELEVPSPMIVNISVNITCSAMGGSPVPDIWWNCCNNDNATHVVLSENQILSVLEFMPSRECNGETCTCFVHHSETTFPEIQKAEKLVVYCKFLDGLYI